MITNSFGNVAQFAIESGIAVPYDKLSQRALGFFVLYVSGNQYGNRSPDATMLACSFDAVSRRLASRGKHTAPFGSEADPIRIAVALCAAVYREDRQRDLFLGLTANAFRDALAQGEVLWAPDGDAAFDDGSHVLQFDEGAQVRLIAFKNSDSQDKLQQSVVEVRLASDRFYELLGEWQHGFEHSRKEALESNLTNR
jgi:hypothetical protein